MIARRILLRVWSVLALGAVGMCGACGRDDNGPSAAGTTVPEETTTTTAPACQAEVTERLDPQSARHILPGSPEPTYMSDPPTSGPHQLGDLPAGAVKDPIPRPKQVALLEAGAVLLQYRDLADDGVAAIESLADGREVVVAPNPTLAAPIVATAWTFKQVCDRVDPATLTAFIAAHAGKVGGEHRG